MSRSLGWGMRETEDTLSRGPLLTGVAHRLWGLKEDRRPRPQEPPFAADVLFLPPKALTSWRLHLFPLKVPAKVESSFNVLEIRAFNTLSQNQILVETERGLVSMRLPSAESVDQVTRHVSSALSKVCPGPGCLIRRGNADTPEGPRDTSPNSETSTSTTHSVCGGFSETYAALCDYNGLHCREEVQWRLGPNGGSPGLQPVVHQTLLQGSAAGATYPEQVGEP
uniref:Capping protein regulator and myosin 1 linker 3 n=1 Tax=Ailuropoda melanoleuca TaxID=9646 RepID=A0A7N5KEL1_AILME